MAFTSWPASISTGTRRLPMNPVAPVTSTLWGLSVMS